MIVTKYPLLETQQRQHADLLKTLRDRTAAFKEDIEELDSLISSLISWFVTHTKEEDRKIGKHINENAVTAQC
jgi:hemerythrin